MSRPYFTEDEKMAYSPFPKWTWKETNTIRRILENKGYSITICSRVGCDRKYHDAWEVERKDIPRLIEQLFRQRIVVEVQAEGHGKASINFVYDYSASQIIDAVTRFQINKEVVL
ncbi:MAG: hypothetical protein K6A34_06345 [Methanobrevibacter sp.]|nr:hypothetical protein [Methanobrevibacter sp.]